jgi:hypothetical protein
MAEVPIVHRVADGRIDLGERQKQNRSSRVAKVRNAFGNHNCRDIIASVLGVAGMSSCLAGAPVQSTTGIISRRFLEGSSSSSCFPLWMLCVKTIGGGHGREK